MQEVVIIPARLIAIHAAPGHINALDLRRVLGKQVLLHFHGQVQRFTESQAILQLREHLIECPGQLPEFITRADRGPGLQVAFGNAAGGEGEIPDRTGNGARCEKRNHHHDDDHDDQQ